MALTFERLEDRKMLASISEDAGIVTVLGSSLDDVIVVASDDSVGVNISINAGQADAVFAAFHNLLITEIIIYGGNGDDAIYSSSPLTKEIFGQGGDDILRGSGGADLIFGNDGNDRIVGGAGNDRLEGQDGLDTYVLSADGNDTVDDDSVRDILFESGYDGDGDGLSGATEGEIGTDPEKFDTDGDLLGDGFENESDNLDPTQGNDPLGDSDGDGLTELQEQIYSTNPDSSDSDGDGTSDFDEIEQGSDPNDPEDEGLEPQSDEVTELVLTVGDHSGSHSERYDLKIGPVFHLPHVDLDVINVDGSEDSDEKEDDFGGFLHPIPEDPNQDRKLTELKIHKVDSPVAGHTQLIFNGSQVRIWKDRERTEEVISRNTEFDSTVDHSVFVESLFESDDFKVLFIRAKFEVDNVDVESQFTVFEGEVQDRIMLITLSFDLDIDSNNDDGFALPQDDQYSEELEDNEYGLGKLVFKSSNQLGDNDTDIVDQFTPVVIRLPAGIDTEQDDLKVRFDFDPVASGVFALWTKG